MKKQNLIELYLVENWIFIVILQKFCIVLISKSTTAALVALPASCISLYHSFINEDLSS